MQRAGGGWGDAGFARVPAVQHQGGAAVFRVHAAASPRPAAVDEPGARPERGERGSGLFGDLPGSRAAPAVSDARLLREGDQDPGPQVLQTPRHALQVCMCRGQEIMAWNL